MCTFCAHQGIIRASKSLQVTMMHSPDLVGSCPTLPAHQQHGLARPTYGVKQGTVPCQQRAETMRAAGQAQCTPPRCAACCSRLCESARSLTLSMLTLTQHAHSLFVHAQNQRVLQQPPLLQIMAEITNHFEQESFTCSKRSKRKW